MTQHYSTPLGQHNAAHGRYQTHYKRSTLFRKPLTRQTQRQLLLSCLAQAAGGPQRSRCSAQARPPQHSVAATQQPPDSSVAWHQAVLGNVRSVAHRISPVRWLQQLSTNEPLDKTDKDQLLDTITGNEQEQAALQPRLQELGQQLDVNQLKQLQQQLLTAVGSAAAAAPWAASLQDHQTGNSSPGSSESFGSFFTNSGGSTGINDNSGSTEAAASVKRAPSLSRSRSSEGAFLVISHQHGLEQATSGVLAVPTTANVASWDSARATSNSSSAVTGDRVGGGGVGITSFATADGSTGGTVPIAIGPSDAAVASSSVGSSSSSNSTSPYTRTAAALPASMPQSSLRFAKHLANVTNGCAPPSTRFESLGWLLFESKRLQHSYLHTAIAPQASGCGPDSAQAAAAGPDSSQAVVSSQPDSLQAVASSPETWVSQPEGLQLLEQVYLIGQAVADLGTADGLQPLSSSNGARAIVSMDYARLLERYLQQHGVLLAECFWAQLPDDKLQAKAIHVSTALQTRCMVHALLFDKLINRVGLEGTSAAMYAAAAGATSSPAGPLAAAITNTVINTSQLHNSPQSSQTLVAAPSAVAHGGSSSSSSSSAGTALPASQGLGMALGSVFGGVFMLVLNVAGRFVHVIVAFVVFAKDLAIQLLMLRAMAAAAKGLAAAGSSQLQLQPVGVSATPAAAAAAAGSHKITKQSQKRVKLPAQAALLQSVVPAAAAAVQPKPPPAATAAAAAPQKSRDRQVHGTSPTVGHLGLLAVSPLTRRPDSASAAANTPQQEQRQVAAAQSAALSPAAVLLKTLLINQQQQQQQQGQHFPIGTDGLQLLSQSLPIMKRKSGKGALAGSRPMRTGTGFKAGDGRLLYQLWAPEGVLEADT